MKRQFIISLTTVHLCYRAIHLFFLSKSRCVNPNLRHPKQPLMTPMFTFGPFRKLDACSFAILVTFERGSPAHATWVLPRLDRQRSTASWLTCSVTCCVDRKDNSRKSSVDTNHNSSNASSLQRMMSDSMPDDVKPTIAEQLNKKRVRWVNKVMWMSFASLRLSRPDVSGAK